VQVAGRVGVAHRNRIVNQHELELEVLPPDLPDLARLEAVVRVDDRAPAGHTLIANRTVRSAIGV